MIEPPSFTISISSSSLSLSLSLCEQVGCTKGDDAGLSNAHMIMAVIPNASEAVV